MTCKCWYHFLVLPVPPKSKTLGVLFPPPRFLHPCSIAGSHSRLRLAISCLLTHVTVTIILRFSLSISKLPVHIIMHIIIQIRMVTCSILSDNPWKQCAPYHVIGTTPPSDSNDPVRNTVPAVATANRSCKLLCGWSAWCRMSGSKYKKDRGMG